MHSHILQLCSWTWQLDAAIYTTLLGLRTMDALNTAVYARMLLGFAIYLYTECCHCILNFSEQFTNFMHLVKMQQFISFRFYEIICIECDNYMRMISKQLAKNCLSLYAFFNELQAAQTKHLLNVCERELRHPSVLSPLGSTVWVKASTWWPWRTCVTWASLTPTPLSVTPRARTRLSSNTPSCSDLRARKLWAAETTTETYICINTHTPVPSKNIHKHICILKRIN